MDFGAALTALGTIAPQQQAAQERARQIDRQNRADALDYQQRTGQIAREKTLGELDAQKVKQANQPIVFGKPEWNPVTKRDEVLAIDPASGGKLIRIPVDGGTDPDQQRQAQIQSYVESLNKLGIDPPPEVMQEFAASIYGVKLPASVIGANGQQLRQLADGSWVYFNKKPSTDGSSDVTPAVNGDGQPVQASRPDRTVTRNGITYKPGDDNKLYGLPNQSTTTTHYGRPASASPKTPTLIPRGAGGAARTPSPSVPRGTATTQRTDPRIVPGFTPKRSQQERNILQTDAQLTDAANNVLPMLEPLKNDNSAEARLRAFTAWHQYQLGFEPTDPVYGPLIRNISLISVAGAGPWMRIGRSKYTFDVIQKHLPQPDSTPARMYESVKWLRDNVVPSSVKSITGQSPSAPSNADPAGIF